MPDCLVKVVQMFQKNLMPENEAGSSEALVSNYQTIRLHFPGDRNVHSS